MQIRSIQRIGRSLQAAIGIIDVAIWLSLPLAAALFDELKQRAFGIRERASQLRDADAMGSGAATI